MAFAVGDFQDFPHDPYCFRHSVSVTKDTNLVKDAINGWYLGWGGDGPEGQFFAYDQIAEDRNPSGGTIGWREEALRFLIVFGDAPAHDPICPIISGLQYPITEETVTGKLVNSGIVFMGFSTRTGYPLGMDDDPRTGDDYAKLGCPKGGTPGQATRLAQATNGIHLLDVPSSEIVGIIKEEILNKLLQPKAIDLTVKNINTPIPNISWKYQDPRGITQKNAEIIITDSVGNIVWDSGELYKRAFHNEIVEVPYGGGRLESNTDYFVKVRVFNGYKWSNWTPDYVLNLSNRVIYNPYEGLSWDSRVLVQTHAHYINDWDKNKRRYGKIVDDVQERYYKASREYKHGYVFLTEHSGKNWYEWLPYFDGKHHVELYNAVECTGKTQHIIALGINELVTPYGIPDKDEEGRYLPFTEQVELSLQQRVNQIIRQKRISPKGSLAAGAVAIAAHPNNSEYPWSREELLNTMSYQAMEIYTHVNPPHKPKDRRALDKWDYLLREGKVVWGVAADDSTPGLPFSLYGIDNGCIAIPWPKGYLPTQSQVLNMIRKGAFYSTTGSKGPKIEKIEVIGSEIHVTTTGESEYIVNFINQRGDRATSFKGGSEHKYTVKTTDRYIRIEVTDALLGGTSWSQPIFFKSNTHGSILLASNELNTFSVSSSSTSTASSGADLTIPEDKHPNTLPEEAVIGFPHFLNIVEPFIDTPKIELSYEHEVVIPYLEDYLFIYYSQESGNDWVKLSSSTDTVQKTVLADIVDTGWYVISTDTTMVIEPTTPPDITISVPESVYETFEVVVESTLDTGIYKVDFYLDDILLGSDAFPYDGWSLTVDPLQYTKGNHILKVIASDIYGQQGEDQVPVNFVNGIDDLVITITSPEANSTLAGKSEVRGTFSSTYEVQSVTILSGDDLLGFAEIDGNNWVSIVTPGELPGGPNNLRVLLEDIYGNKAESVLPIFIGPLISFTPDDTYMRIGDTRELWLTVSGLENNLYSVNATMSYNPNELEIIEVLEGSFFNNDGNPSTFSYSIDSSIGSITINASRTCDTAAPDWGGQIGIFTVRSKNSSVESKIIINSSELSTPMGELLSHDVQNMSAYINAAPVITNLPANVTTNAGMEFTYDVTAVDADDQGLEYYLMGEVPEGMSITNTGTIMWHSPVVGQYEIMVGVQDSINKIVTTILTLSVTQPPSVISTDPADGATGINVNKSVRVVFDMDIKAGLKYNNIAIQTNGSPISLQKRINENILTIEPTSELDMNTAYTVIIPAEAVTNTAGEAVAQPYSFGFSTEGSLGVDKLIVGNVQSFAIMNNRTLKIWGLNSRGQLGLGDLAERILPEGVGYMTTIKQVAGGNSHSLILLEDGTVYASGRNDFGQLGLGDNADRMHFEQIPGLVEIIQIAAGGDHSLALSVSGEVFSWGYNASGQLGIGNTTNRNTPSLVIGLSNVKHVEAGQQHSLALTNSETVYSWGANFHGQLGLGNTKDSLVPVLITGLTNVKQIMADGFHSLALLNDGTAKSWGRNFFGQLGLGNTRRYTSPMLIPGLNNVIHLEASVDSSYSLHADGTVRAWGRNDDGQLGLGDTNQRNSPTLITAIQGVRQISAGGWHAMAILEDETPLVWGWNYYGQLGLGDKESRLLPTVLIELFY
ncbi:MAG: Ig-like domain-containing protein [Clostridiales bacterium]|nr:Ig-like domain-containing protein [Clostridiales bacterium]